MVPRTTKHAPHFAAGIPRPRLRPRFAFQLSVEVKDTPAPLGGRSLPGRPQSGEKTTGVIPGRQIDPEPIVVLPARLASRARTMAPARAPEEIGNGQRRGRARDARSWDRDFFAPPRKVVCQPSVNVS